MASTTFKIQFADFGKMMLKLGANADKALNAGLLSAAMRARVELVSETDTKRVMNTGYYRTNWKSERIIGTSTMGVFGKRGIHVWNASPYAGVIELGRRPGARMPPTEPIARWAQRKFSIPYEQARGMAFVIARAIAKRGLPARRVLADASPRIENIMVQEIKRELNRALGNKP